MATPVGQAGLIYKDLETQPLMLLLATVIRPRGFVLNTHLNSSLYVNKDDVELWAAFLAQIYPVIKSLLLPGEELFCLFTPLRHPLSSLCSLASSPTLSIPSQTASSSQPSAPSPRVSPAGPPWHRIQPLSGVGAWELALNKGGCPGDMELWQYHHP